MFHLTLLNSSLLIIFGFFTGVLGSVMGVGGGIFVVPLLVLALGVPIHQAIAVSLAAIVATSSAVASVNVERGLANMRLGVVLEVTTALGSIAGAIMASRLSSNIVQILFALVLFPVSVIMFLKGRRALAGVPGMGPLGPAAGPVGVLSAMGPIGPVAARRLRAGSAPGPIQPMAATPPIVSVSVGVFDSEFFDPSIDSRTSYRVKNMKPASVISFFAGGLSGLLGLGGGIIQVPVMHLMCGVPIKAAAATSNFLIGVSAAASAFIYFKKGYLLPELAAVIVVGVLLGSFIGIHILHKARSEKIQIAFSVLTFLVAVKMLAKAL